jgi:NAD(P)-dependent dehydrogenase (short-subunit alcohol dehydrogenase family)
MHEMESFEGKLAVVTGGGSGMGRELVVQLAGAGASVATCDLNEDTLAETRQLAEKAGAGRVAITTHSCDVSDRAQVDRFRDEVLARHETDHINLLFNNAGVGGGGSFVTGDQAEWDRTFSITWGGVFNCARAFMPLLVASEEGAIVNTSSVNGFWASLGPDRPHTAYSSAKFAVKGFTEALITDLRINAPHVSAHVVMPGHVGTDIVLNSFKALGRAQIATPEQLKAAGVDDPSQIEGLVKMFADGFRESAPMTAAEAATAILDAVRNGEWRILVGEDAKRLDDAVRRDPVGIYDVGGVGADGLRTLP